MSEKEKFIEAYEVLSATELEKLVMLSNNTFVFLFKGDRKSMPIKDFLKRYDRNFKKFYEKYKILIDD